VKIRYELRHLVLGLLCVVTPLSGVGTAGAADNRPALYQDAERAELLVVRITAPQTEGAGIIFHVDDKHVYGITAKHVLFHQGRIVEGLQAELRAWPRQLPIVGHRLHHEEDLAVFWADLGPLNLSRQEVLQGIPLDQLGASKDLDPGDALSSLGHSTAGAWISPKEPVRFAREDGPGGFLFEYSCPQGHSGGAVFDKDWRLVGMMIDEERPYCRALRVEPIFKIVQGWKLTISLRLPPPRDVDKAASRQITVAVVDFDNRSDKDLPNLGFVAQDITTSYLHTLPGVVLVTRDRLDSVRREIKLPATVQSGEGISRVGRLLNADALVTGSIVRYDVERRTFEGFGTSALQDIFRMSLSLQILDVDTGRVQFSKNFDVERTKQYPKATSAPSRPIDLTNELLEALLTQAQKDIRSALSQVAGGLSTAGGFIDVPVSSTPAEADVILNEIYMGKTPITLQLTDSTHDVQLVLAGYEPWRYRVKVQPGKSIDANLVPKRPF
jgi:hypothetical protein